MKRGTSTRRGRGGGAGRRAPAQQQQHQDVVDNNRAALPQAQEAAGTSANAEATPSDTAPVMASPNPTTTTSNPTVKQEPASSTTGNPAPRPAGTAGTSRGAKFKPKNVRRNEEDRARLAQEEALKESERMAEERRKLGRSTFRGRRGGRAGRGGRGGRADGIGGFGEPFVPTAKGSGPASSHQTSGSSGSSNAGAGAGAGGSSTRGGHRPQSKNTPVSMTQALFGDHNAIAINSDLFWPERRMGQLSEEDQRAVNYLESIPGPLPRGLPVRRHAEKAGRDEIGTDTAKTDAARLTERSQRRSRQFMQETLAQGLNDGDTKPFLFKMLPRSSLPQLRPTQHTRPTRPSEPFIKKEDDDMVMQDREPIDLTGNEEETEEADGELDDYHNTYHGEDLYANDGLAGRLLVRKSGKVEFDWGGVPLELKQGHDHAGVLAYMIVDGDENKKGAPSEAYVGKVVGMGQLMGEMDMSLPPLKRKDPLLALSKAEFQKVLDDIVAEKETKGKAKNKKNGKP